MHRVHYALQADSCVRLVDGAPGPQWWKYAICRLHMKYCTYFVKVRYPTDTVMLAEPQLATWTVILMGK